MRAPHTQRPSTPGIKAPAVKGAGAGLQQRPQKPLWAGQARRAGQTRRQAQHICATLTTERPASADTVRLTTQLPLPETVCDTGKGEGGSLAFLTV